MAHRKRRLFLRLFAILVLLLVGLVVALPLWFPWILRPAAKSLGLRYGDYEREGYSRFRISGLTLSNKAGSFQAEQATGYIPTIWLWKVLNRETNAPYVQVEAWRYEVSGNSPDPTAATAPSVYTNVTQVQRTLSVLNTWIPHATAAEGTVRVKEFSARIPHARWLEGNLSAETQLPGTNTLQLNAAIVSDNAVRVLALAEELAVHSQFTLTNSGPEVLLEGHSLWHSNRVELTAQFARGGALPQNASLRVENFNVSGDTVKLERYQNVTGSLRVDWNALGIQSDGGNGAQFQIQLAADAAPLSPELPTLNAVIRASGNTNAARIDTARVKLPGLVAELSEGTALEFQPPFVFQPSRLHVSVDLAAQHRIAASGTLDGGATLFPSADRYPRIQFDLTGNQVTVSNLHTRALSFRGEFEWPELRLEGTRVTLHDGSEAVLTGAVNLASNIVERGELSVTGTFGRDLLPEGYSFDRIALNSAVSGPLAALVHSGKLSVDQFRVPRGRPMLLNAAWNGRALSVENATIMAAAGDASVSFTAAVNFSERIRELTVSELALHTTSQGELRMEQPFRIAFENAAATNVSGWKLDCERFRLGGGGRSVELASNIDWPERGAVQITATNLNSGLLEDFFPWTNGTVELRELAFSAHWTNSPVAFNVDVSAGLTNKAGHAFAFDSSLAGTEQGIAIRELSVSSATQLVCRAQGELPFVLAPSFTNDLVQVLDEGALRLRAFTETNSVLWDELAGRLPLRLQRPGVLVDVSGTWARPRGAVKVEAERIELRSATPSPVVTALEFNLTMDRERADARLSALVQDQPVTANAQLPLGQGFWAGLRRDRKLPDFRTATGQVTIENAKIASFVQFAPEILSPQGEFSLNVTLEPDKQLKGEAILYNAGTRPLASLGPLRAIDGRLVFSGRELALSNLVAEIGGQRVAAMGMVHLDDSVWREMRLPPFGLKVTGTNVPLVRQANVLVRADLNLAITNDASSNALVGGSVTLRDSFLLSSLKDLAPGKVSSPERRPPFFSIEAEPLAAWRLNLQVDGDRFLKVQSPFFRGVVSTTLQLEGNLREPLALGEVRINSGFVTFPFGVLEVQQGFVTLSSDNPYHPQLFVTAASQRMGYDVKMEVSGPADQPVIQFSSSPPLSSEQIVLLLTTGQTPQGAAAASTTRQRAQGVAMFIGKNLLSELGIGGSGESRLTIRSGEQLTDTGRPTYDVEYKLDDDWAVVGEYDRFNQYNIGLKWRVYSK